jgi:hypothetical protein
VNWIPEQRLWQSVINQALHDLTNLAWRHDLERKQALSWFTNRNKDFRLVCDLAGYDERYICKKAMLIMAAKDAAKKARAGAYPCEKNRA